MSNSIYNNSRLYNDIHWWKRNDIDFWSLLFSEISGNKVLEIGCGTGRLAKALIRDGALYTGIDLSDELLKDAKKYFLKNNDSVSFVKCNMTNFNVNEKFDILTMKIILAQLFAYLRYNNFLNINTQSRYLRSGFVKIVLL